MALTQVMVLLSVQGTATPLPQVAVRDLRAFATATNLVTHRTSAADLRATIHGHIQSSGRTGWPCPPASPSPRHRPSPCPSPCPSPPQSPRPQPHPSPLQSPRPQPHPPPHPSRPSRPANIPAGGWGGFGWVLGVWRERGGLRCASCPGSRWWGGRGGVRSWRVRVPLRSGRDLGMTFGVVVRRCLRPSGVTVGERGCWAGARFVGMGGLETLRGGHLLLYSPHYLLYLFVSYF